MTRPTKESIDAIKEDLMRDLSIVKAQVGDTDAMAGVETFCVIALRLMAKTNPSKIRDIAMTTEIAYWMKGTT